MGFAERINNSLHGAQGAKCIIPRHKGISPRGWPKSYENKIIRPPFFRGPCDSSNGRDLSRLEFAQPERTSSSARGTSAPAAHGRKYEGQDSGAVLSEYKIA